MKHNWALIAAVLAVLAVPFGIALFEDATTEPEDPWADVALEEPALAAEPEPAWEPEVPRGEVVAEFERAEPIDLSFLDELADGEPGLGPELERFVELGETLEAGVASRFPRASFESDPGIRGGPIRSVTYRFAPEPKVRVLLRRKWGSPEVAGFSASVWLDERAGVRAALIEEPEAWRLSISRYQPLEEMLERRADGSFGAEPGSYLGSKTIVSGERVTRERLAGEGDAELVTIHVDPPPASAAASTPITLLRQGGRITESSIQIDLSLDPGASRAARSRLESQLGAHTSRRIGEAVEIRIASEPGFGAFVYDDRLVIDRRL